MLFLHSRLRVGMKSVHSSCALKPVETSKLFQHKKRLSSCISNSVM